MVAPGPICCCFVETGILSVNPSATSLLGLVASDQRQREASRSADSGSSRRLDSEGTLPCLVRATTCRRDANGIEVADPLQPALLGPACARADTSRRRNADSPSRHTGHRTGRPLSAERASPMLEASVLRVGAQSDTRPAVPLPFRPRHRMRPHLSYPAARSDRASSGLQVRVRLRFAAPGGRCSPALRCARPAGFAKEAALP